MRSKSELVGIVVDDPRRRHYRSWFSQTMDECSNVLTNSKVMFVLSAGSRLLSQREPQSLPLDALSFVGAFSLLSFFLIVFFCCIYFEFLRQLIQSLF